MWRSKLLLSLLTFALVFALTFVLWRRQGAFYLTRMDGNSMTPTLKPGVYLVDALSPRLRPLQKGDIITFRKGGIAYTKRIHAVAGQQVIEMWIPGNDGPELVSHTKFIAFSKLTGRLAAGRHFTHIRVPPGYLYVLGDNFHSMDSRDFGLVRIPSVIGVIRPLNGTSFTLVGKEIIRAMGQGLAQPSGLLASVCLMLAVVIFFYNQRRRARLAPSS